KLLEFDYDIQYKQGKVNLATDALSRVECTKILSMTLTMVSSNLLQAKTIEDLKKDPKAKKNFTFHDKLRRKSKSVICNDVALKNQILM
ncbi:hypothetical protein V2J09_016653, partial [Rumex salicifolius]